MFLDPIDRMSEFLIFGRFFLQEISPFVSIFLPTKFNLNVPQRICLSAPLKEMEISYFSILHFLKSIDLIIFAPNFHPEYQKGIELYRTLSRYWFASVILGTGNL